MDVLKVFPKELHVRIDLTETEVAYILNFLDHCEATMDLSDEDNRKCNQFVTKELFPSLDLLYQEMKRLKDGP